MSFLQLKGVSVSYMRPGGAVHAAVLCALDFDLEPGSFTAIKGVSGSGKSTLFRIMGGLQEPTQGQVFVQGQDLSALNEPSLAEFRNQRLGLVFQDHRLVPQCTAMENILLPTVASGDTASKRAYAAELLNEVGLSDFAHHFPAQLSGGQSQRVALARALVQSPEILLADEPTGALDRANSETLGTLLEKLRSKRGLTVVCFTHCEIMASFASSTLVLEAGSLRGA